IYEVFITKLKDSFQHIALVDLSITVEEKEYDEQWIVDYWNYFLKTQVNLSPAYVDLVRNQQPIVSNNKIMLTARNDDEANALKKRLEESFGSFCRKIGARAYKLDVQVKMDVESIKRFKEERAKEDQQIVVKTVQEKEKRNGEKEKRGDGRLLLGYRIPDEAGPIEEIQEEERRITVQGYVFASEIRELRSGRSLLILKATDYTDSLQVKMFSRDDEDAEKFKQAKEGIWI